MSEENKKEENKPEDNKLEGGEIEGKRRGLVKTYLSILKEEKFHFLWLLLVIIFAFASCWVQIFMGQLNDLSESLTGTGDLYLSAIGLLAPCLFDLLATIYFDKKDGKGTHFLGIRIALVVLGFLICFLTAFLAVGIYKGDLRIKIPATIVMVLISFICYLSKFFKYPEHASIDDSTVYDDLQKQEDEISKQKNISDGKGSIGGQEVNL